MVDDGALFAVYTFPVGPKYCVKDIAAAANGHDYLQRHFDEGVRHVRRCRKW